MAKKIAKSNTPAPSIVAAKHGRHEVQVKHIQIHGENDVNLSLDFNILDFNKKNDKVDFMFELGDYKINFSIIKHG